jgi:hypothetical protein
MADELGIKTQTTQSKQHFKIEFISKKSTYKISFDNDGFDLSPYDEISDDIQHLWENFNELIDEKREKEKLTPEQLKLIKKKNGDKNKILGLSDGYLCWVNGNLVGNIKNKLYVNMKEYSEEFTFEINEIDELLDLVYSLP